MHSQLYRSQQTVHLKGFTYWPWLENRVSNGINGKTQFVIIIDMFRCFQYLDVPSHSWGIVRCCEYPHRIWIWTGSPGLVFDQAVALARQRDLQHSAWSNVVGDHDGKRQQRGLLVSWFSWFSWFSKGSKMILQGSSGRPLAKYGNMIKHDSGTRQVTKTEKYKREYKRELLGLFQPVANVSHATGSKAFHSRHLKTFASLAAVEAYRDKEWKPSNQRYSESMRKL